MAEIIIVIYLIVGYWATGQTIYANKIVIYSGYNFFLRKLSIALFFGYVLIPVAIIKNVISRKDK